MAKSPRIEFTLEEVDGNVRAVLTIDSVLLLDFENEGAPSVRRGRVSIGADELARLANAAGAHDDRFSDPTKWLDFYVTSREREVFEAVKDIRKAIRRMERAGAHADVARAARKSLPAK